MKIFSDELGMDELRHLIDSSINKISKKTRRNNKTAMVIAICTMVIVMSTIIGFVVYHLKKHNNCCDFEDYEDDASFYTDEEFE